MDRHLKVWAAVCLVLGVAMAAAGLAPGRLPPGADPASWRLLAAAGAALALSALAVGVLWRGLAPLLAEEDEAGRAVRRPYLTLFLASFVALFVEVTLIRYASSQVRVFAFYKNVPLVAAFLGLGIGCCQSGQSGQAAARRGRAREALLFLLWLLPLAAFLAHGTVALDGALGRWAALGSSEHILGDVVAARPRPGQEWASQLAMGLFCAAAFAAVAGLFVFLGRLLGDAFERVPRLPGYTANLLGSLAGILAFVALSVAETPPWVWLAAGLAPLLWWTEGRRRAALALALLAASAAMVAPAAGGETIWSRYQKLVGREIPPGPGGTGTPSPAYLVQISDVFYQVAMDLRPAALARLPRNPFPHYDAAFRLTPRKDRVLVVGAGTGNDVAAALRAGARRVDAVDIDPAIVRLGRLHHPERPYGDPRVHVIVDDARRAFRRLPPGTYDAVVFGLLDSHTQLGISSVRLDNYVFTLESLAAARRLLRPGGSLVITASTFRGWFRRRFAAMLAATCDTPVATFSSGIGSTYACQVADPTRPPPGAAALAGTALADAADAAGSSLPTDDWPFLYLPRREVPRAYLLAIVLLALASLALLRAAGLAPSRFGAFHAHLFFLGAAFLLMEVYAINRLSLLFGTTWLVSAVTIAVVLALVVAANLTVELARPLPYPAAYGALALALLAGYWIGPEAALGRGTGFALLYALLLLLPIYFAGLVFSRSFGGAAAAGPALGVNILGSVLGGLTEYATMAVGIRGLALLALAFYLASWLAQRRWGAGSPAVS